MYSLKQFLKRSPSEIATGVIVLVNLGSLVSLYDISKDAVSGLNIALVTVLGLFYINKTTVNADSLSELKQAQDESFIFGTEMAAPVVGQAESVTVNESTGDRPLRAAVKKG